MNTPRILPVDVHQQPDDTTCGPTCLEAVYRFHDAPQTVSQVIDEVRHLETGGTLAVLLGCHALQRGFRATLYTYNLQVFDPSWFVTGADLARKLEEQEQHKTSRRLKAASHGYQEFLALGGQVKYRELRPELFAGILERGLPVLTGLSSTYLYDSVREFKNDYDDLRGEPAGHFVVICGYDASDGTVAVADPLHDNPKFQAPYYTVGVHRLMGAILLGILTYDANLLVLEPEKK